MSARQSVRSVTTYGALVGLFWGLLFAGHVRQRQLLEPARLHFGGVGSALIGAISHSSRGGERDFSSESETRADHYEVQVEDGYAAEAERVLSTCPPPELLPGRRPTGAGRLPLPVTRDFFLSLSLSLCLSLSLSLRVLRQRRRDSRALTIVLTVGVTRGWRSTSLGASAAAVVLAVVIAALGRAISALPFDVPRVVVGGLLLVFVRRSTAPRGAI